MCTLFISHSLLQVLGIWNSNKGFPFAWNSGRVMYSRCCLLSQTERCFGKKPCSSFFAFFITYFRALVVLLMEKFKTKCKALFSSRGCLGSCSQPRFTVVDEPSNRLRIQGQPVRKNSISEDFWSTSTIDMDNSAILSQISNTSNNPLDAHGASSTSNTSEFVNHGLLLCNQTRQQWVGNKKSRPQTELREPTISWNATYDSLLSTNKRFQRPIPLPEMIDFLVDIWEQEGLYD